MEILRSSYPKIWSAIVPDGQTSPGVSEMVELCKRAGVQVPFRPSGKLCLETILSMKDALEEKLRQDTPEIHRSTPNDQPEVSGAEETYTAKAASPLPFDQTSQCADTLLAEAEARLQSCISTTYKTDAGTITLEGDLAIFLADKPNPEDWLREMNSVWESRLDSRVMHEFREALELWVLAQKELQT